MKLTALWSPEQQFQNKDGSVLVAGKIYVYNLDRTQLVTTYANGSGTVENPNPIILDGNGRALCFANEEFKYTAVVCDWYGKELFSFEPVGLGGAGSDAQVSTEITSETLNVEKTFDPHTNTNTFDIELKDKDIDHWIGQYGTPIQISGDSMAETLPLPATDRRDYVGSFVDRIEDGKYMYLKPGLYQVDCVIRFTQSSEDLQNELGEVLVYTGNGNADETGAWQLDGAGPYTNGNRHTLHASFVRKVLDEGQTSNINCSNLLFFAPGTPFAWSEAYIQRLSVVRLDSISTGSGEGSSGIERVIHDDTLSGDGTGESPLSCSGALAGKQDKLIPGEGISIDENNVISCSAQGGGGGPTYTAGQYIDITPENVINVSGLQPEGNYLTPEDLEGYATTEDVEEATSGKLDASAYRAPVQSDWNQTNSSALDYIKNKPTIPSLDGYATEQYVIEQTSGKLDASDYTAPVNADWNSEGGLSEILNKPDVAGLIPGQGIEFTPSGDNYVVNCTSSGDVSKQYVDQAILSATSGKLDASDYTAPVQSDWNQSNDEALDFIKNKPTIPSLDGYATEQYVIEQTSGKLNTSDYTAPEQSDWNEADAADLAYIKNKPVEIGFVAGEGIRFEDLSSAIKISCSAQGGNYTAGDGIAINSGEISVNIGKNLAFETAKSWFELDAERAQTGSSSYGFSLLGRLDANKVAALKNGTANYKPNFNFTGSYSNLDYHFAICKKSAYNQPDYNHCLGATETLTLDGSTVLKANETYVVDFSSVDASSTATWSDIEADPTSYYLAAVCWYANQGISSWVGYAYANNATGHPGQIEVPDPSAPKVLYAVDQAGGGSTYTPGTGIDITNDVISVNSAVAMKSDIPAAQVQSDWTEDDTEDPAFIKNKPSEYELVAGAGVSIVPSGTNYIISSTGGGGGGSTYTAGDGINITNDVISVDPAVVPSKTDLQSKLDTSAYVAPVNSDWTASAGLAQILNKPDTEEMDVQELSAGPGISINNGVISVSGQYLTQADLAGYATQTWVGQQGFLESSDLAGYATQEWVGQQGFLTSIPSSYATDSEVADAVAAGTSGKQNKLTSVTDVQLVNALPASPVAGVLYLIPEA